MTIEIVFVLIIIAIAFILFSTELVASEMLWYESPTGGTFSDDQENNWR